MREIDIRKALNKQLQAKFRNYPDALIIDEFVLTDARIDIAVINCSLFGYEIKSEKDNLSRLPFQRNAYKKIFDKIYIVTCENHLDNVIEIVPSFWGIQIAKNSFNGVKIIKVRSAEQNIEIESEFIAKLLWKREALSILEDVGITKGIKSKPLYVLRKLLSANVSANRLKNYVRNKIKSRGNWRVGQ